MKRIASQPCSARGIARGLLRALRTSAHPEYLAIEPIEYPGRHVSTAPATGSLFVPRRSVSLFTDTRAHEVGDIVSVVLTEATSAAKSADTELDKSSGIEITSPRPCSGPR
jgi:flagellar L-ring protein precursor FlgH